MIYPNFLRQNSCIGVPAPSDGARDDRRVNRLSHSKQFFESEGFRLKLSENLYKSTLGRSGSAEYRGKEVTQMFADKDIDFIICAGGGEFLLESLPYTDFEVVRTNPKFICGFSDPTGLLFPITTKLDIATIYGQNFGAFGSEKFDKSQYDFLNIAQGKLITEESYPLYENERTESVTGLEPSNLTEKTEWKTLDGKGVKLSGRIVGGCFDIITELAGTKYDGTADFNERYKDDGIVWYFDNCEKSLEDTIRILWKMNELDYFKYAKGVIFGRFGNDFSCCGYTVGECLKDSALSRLDIPIIYDADISHKAPSLSIINGSIATVECEAGKGKMSFELK